MRDRLAVRAASSVIVVVITSSCQSRVAGEENARTNMIGEKHLQSQLIIWRSEKPL